RKVLGASVPGLLALFSKDFATLVLAGFAVAVPVSYVVMDRWLADFAYRVDLGVGTFLLAGGAVLAIALFTVSRLALKAALAVKGSLRSRFMDERAAGQAAAASCRAGRRTMKVLPRPGSLCAQICPPCRSAMRRQMASPMPVPSYCPRPWSR